MMPFGDAMDDEASSSRMRGGRSRGGRVCVCVSRTDPACLRHHSEAQKERPPTTLSPEASPTTRGAVVPIDYSEEERRAGSSHSAALAASAAGAGGSYDLQIAEAIPKVIATATTTDDMREKGHSTDATPHFPPRPRPRARTSGCNTYTHTHTSLGGLRSAASEEDAAAFALGGRAMPRRRRMQPSLGGREMPRRRTLACLSRQRDTSEDTRLSSGRRDRLVGSGETRHASVLRRPTRHTHTPPPTLLLRPRPASPLRSSTDGSSHPRLPPLRSTQTV